MMAILTDYEAGDGKNNQSSSSSFLSFLLIAVEFIKTVYY